MSDIAREGFEKIAFGGVSDVIKLMLGEEEMSAAQLKKLDLFNVAEIKRPKNGGFEVRFFDRLKALEMLMLIGGAEQGDADAFFDALQKGAQAVSSEDAE